LRLDNRVASEVNSEAMIVINVMELIKFMLDSIPNYLSVLLLIVFTAFLFTSIVSILIDKFTQSACTILMVYRDNSKVKNTETND
jgi:hypothetical protein